MQEQQQRQKRPSLELSCLNHLSVTCEDLSTSKRFYRDVLGFREVKRPGSLKFEGSWLFNYNVGVHLIGMEPGQPRPPKKTHINPRSNHLSFQTTGGSAESLQEAQRALDAMGVEYVCAKVQEGDMIIDQVFFHDPDGNMIELCNCQCLPVVPLSRSASAECSFSACANRQQQQQQEEACMPRLPSLGMAQRLRAVVEGDGGDGPDTPVCQGEGVPAGGTFSPMRLSG